MRWVWLRTRDVYVNNLFTCTKEVQTKKIRTKNIKNTPVKLRSTMFPPHEYGMTVMKCRYKNTCLTLLIFWTTRLQGIKRIGKQITIFKCNND